MHECRSPSDAMVARMMRFPDMRHVQRGRVVSLAEIGGICSSRGAFMEGLLERPGIQLTGLSGTRKESEQRVEGRGNPLSSPFRALRSLAPRARFGYFTSSVTVVELTSEPGVLPEGFA